MLVWDSTAAAGNPREGIGFGGLPRPVRESKSSQLPGWTVVGQWLVRPGSRAELMGEEADMVDDKAAPTTCELRPFLRCR